MAPVKKRRTLIETELYRRDREFLGLSWKRLDEVLTGVTIKIAVEPTYFPALPKTEIRRAKTQAYPPDVPSLSIWFTVEGDRVILQHIETYEPDADLDFGDDTTLGEGD
jgi:hypothetical protein